MARDSRDPALCVPHTADASTLEAWRAASAAPVEAAEELLFRHGGQPAGLRNVYGSTCAFLIGGGPSFLSVDASRLNSPGFITMGLNNSVKTYRPSTWVCVEAG